MRAGEERGLGPRASGLGRAAVIAGVIAGLGGSARAGVFDNMEDAQGVAWLHYELADWHDVQDTGPPSTRQGFSDLVLAGARLHGFVGSGRVGYHAGIDLAAGSTISRGGFAYDVALLPLGIGVRFGETSFVAFGTGVGAMGAVGTIDDAVTLPLDVTAEAGGSVRVLARVRAAYVAGAAGRHDGAPSIPFADELDAELALRIGAHGHADGFPWGNGYFIGAAYREMAGSRYLGVVIGYSIDLATRPRHAEPE